VARPSRPQRSQHASGAKPLLLRAFVEGQRTEEDYLKHLWRPRRAAVNLMIDKFRGTPMALVERAVRERKAELRDAKKGRGVPADEVWCVFDFDVHPNVPEAIALAVDNEIGVAASNPCIELWFILHHRSQTAHIERHDAQRQSATLLGCEKALSSQALAALDPLYGDAMNRAQSLDLKHEGDGSPPRSNPSSDVWRVAERLFAADRLRALIYQPTLAGRPILS
jgi:RloB-like protein